MTFPTRKWRLPKCSLGRFLFLAFLLGAGQCSVAWGDDLKISVTLGIGGRYRPTAWFPVVASVTNAGGEAVRGQIQVFAAGDDRRGRFGGSPGQSAVFARPVAIPATAGPQIVSIDTRGLDATRDNLTVQIAEGADGNGRVLAKTASLGAGSALVTGTPVGERDLFLVSLAGDSSAFTFLSGQKWGLQHAPDGPRPTAVLSPIPFSRFRGLTTSSYRPPTPNVQVASASAADLPEKAAGYGGVDAVLLRDDAPLDALSEAQTDALKAWVASGGHLIVCGGSDVSHLSSPALADLLPARLTGAHAPLAVPPAGLVALLSLSPKPDSRMLAKAADGTPLVVAGPYGAGTVVMTAYDPTTPPFRAWSGADETAFWRMLLTAGGQRPSSLIGLAAYREANASGYAYGSSGGQLTAAVMRAPSLDAPGIQVIGLFLVTYLVVLVPLNYFVLKRLNKKEWAWGTIPVLVLVFAAGTYGVGYASKGGALFVNRAAVVETTAGQRQAGVVSAVGLFSPHRDSYTLTLPDGGVLAAPPGTGEDYGYRSSPSSSEYGPTRFVQDAQDTNLRDVSVNMWAMRAYDAQTVTDLGGSVNARLIYDAATGELSGSVTNATAHTLTHCAVLFRGASRTFGDLGRGATASLSLAGSLGGMPYYPSLTDTFNVPTGGGLLTTPTYGDGRSRSPELAGNAQDRMRPALAEYARSLGRSRASSPYFTGSYAGETPGYAFQPRDNEAIIVGWANDADLAGPAPQVNGRSVTLNSVSLVVIHVPVK